MNEDDISTDLSSQQMLDQWKLIDVDSWGPVRKGTKALQKLRCLHPPLIRLRISGGTPVVLSKPVMVVCVLHLEKDIQIDEHRESETPQAIPALRSSEAQSVQTVARQPIREEILAETSSMSGTSDPEHARKSRRSRQKGSRRQSSDKGLISHNAKHAESRLSSPERDITTRRTLSPDTYHQAAQRDAARHRRESRSQAPKDHEHLQVYSHRVSAAEEESSNHHVATIRPYDIEERQPGDLHATTVQHRDPNGLTSPGSGRRPSGVTVRYVKRENSRSRDKRTSIVGPETITNSPGNPNSVVPPANSNPGVRSVFNPLTLSTSGPWRNPPQTR